MNAGDGKAELEELAKRQHDTCLILRLCLFEKVTILSSLRWRHSGGAIEALCFRQRGPRGSHDFVR
jgi:hypothetical protein